MLMATWINARQAMVLFAVAAKVPSVPIEGNKSNERTVASYTR